MRTWCMRVDQWACEWMHPTGKSNLPASFAGYITVSGLNFGKDGYRTPTMSFTSFEAYGTTDAKTVMLPMPCRSTSWTSSTTVQCQLVSAMDSYITIPDREKADTFIILINKAGTSQPSLLSSLSFDAPVASSAKPDNYPRSGGLSMTILGLTFGTYSSTPTTMTGSEACSTTTWTSSTTVTCEMSALTASGTAAMTVSALVGTRMAVFSFDALVVSSILPFNAPSFGSLTLSGLNFGAHSFTPTAGVELHQGLPPWLTTSWTSGTSVQCLPDALGPAVSVMVILSRVVGTTQWGYTFDAPSLSFAGSNAAPSGGGLLTMLGVHFGQDDASAAASIGKDTCETTTWTSVTKLACRMASSSSVVAGFAMVTVDNVVGSLAASQFTFDGVVHCPCTAICALCSRF